MDVTSYLLGKKSGGSGPTPTGETLKIKRGTSTYGGYWPVFDDIDELEIDDTSCEYMFYAYNGTKIPKLNGSEKVTNTSYMFWNIYLVEELDLSYFDTTSLTNISYMFKAMPILKELNLKGFNTSKVKSMSGTFQNCYKLAKLDISTFDFDAVTSSSSMFNNCGRDCLQTDGAYADGIPYVYVKDATAQNWVLTANNGHPNTWTTDNVIIKSS